MTPQMNEDPSPRGIDFLCQSASGKNFVEVTSIGAKTLAEDTGLAVEISDLKGGAFGMPTPLLQDRIKKKMEQLWHANYQRFSRSVRTPVTIRNTRSTR